VSQIPPEDVTRALLDTLKAFRDATAEPWAPEQEVQTWPICTPEQEYGGGVWCADEECPLDCENSEIGDFRDGVFTLAELHEAIGEHIAKRRERESWEVPDA
jgi:hypothetical protein